MSMEKENRTPPTALVLCTDERLFRFFEIELAHLGIKAVRETMPDEPPCMAIADTDEHPLDTLQGTILPPDCPTLAFGQTAVSLPAGRGMYLRRPFALLDLEDALRRLATAKATFPVIAAPLAVATATPIPVEATPTEPLLEVTDDTITLGGQPLVLTPAEATILRRLYANRGEVVNREELAALLGGGGNSVEVYICHLRTKIEKPLGRRLIRTVRGQGYVLE